MRKELMENPEFFKAFPHMQRAFDKNQDDIHNLNVATRLQKDESPQLILNGTEYFEDKTVKWVDKNAETPFF
jgi:hypothetical protein